MNTKFLLSATVLAIAASASASSFAFGLGTEATEQVQPQSSLTREQVRAETRAALAHGGLERSSYDEQISVATERQAQQASTTSRADVRAETRAFYKAHPNSEYEREIYGTIGG